MTLLFKTIINTREDLDSIQGTQEHNEFITALKASIFQKRDIQIYPENYNTPDYKGEKLEPIWSDVEDLTSITKFGFTKNDFL